MGKLCKCLSKLTNVYNREKHNLCHCDKLQAIPLIKMRSEIKHSGSLLKQVPRKHPTSINLVSQQLFFFHLLFFCPIYTGVCCSAVLSVGMESKCFTTSRSQWEIGNASGSWNVKVTSECYVRAFFPLVEKEAKRSQRKLLNKVL